MSVDLEKQELKMVEESKDSQVTNEPLPEYTPVVKDERRCKRRRFVLLFAFFFLVSMVSFSMGKACGFRQAHMMRHHRFRHAKGPHFEGEDSSNMETQMLALKEGSDKVSDASMPPQPPCDDEPKPFPHGKYPPPPPPPPFDDEPKPFPDDKNPPPPPPPCGSDVLCWLFGYPPPPPPPPHHGKHHGKGKVAKYEWSFSTDKGFFSASSSVKAHMKPHHLEVPEAKVEEVKTETN